MSFISSQRRRLSCSFPHAFFVITTACLCGLLSSGCDDEETQVEESSPRIDMYRPFVESFDAMPPQGGEAISVSLKTRLIKDLRSK